LISSYSLTPAGSYFGIVAFNVRFESSVLSILLNLVINKSFLRTFRASTFLSLGGDTFRGFSKSI
jgi:hypothetical protein